jgi:glycosyltransferase involved in cell wall biosynthesis
MAIILSALIRKKYVLSIDSVEQPAVSKITFVVKCWMIQRSALVFVPGLASKKFMMEKFSVPESKIVCGAYALDGVALEKRIWELRKSGVREKVRGKLGIKRDASVFLMVANMIPTRQYPITSAGFVEFAKEHEDCVFVMVGKGQDYAKMTRYVKDHACLRAIEGCSFDEMLELYAASDVYVHGGKEPASTALVIGAIAHLPLISSDAVGCSFDVLEDNGSGFMVRDYKSAHAWSETFTKAMNNADAWQGLGDKARTLSRKLDADKVAEEFARLLYLV